MIVKIYNEFFHSPIWVYTDEGIIDEPKIISDDNILQELCEKASELYSSYYEFDCHGEACWFNKEKEKAEKDTMMEIIKKIISRLNEINDGSFDIEDLETSRLKNL